MIPQHVHQTAPSLNLTAEERRVLRANQGVLGDTWRFSLYDDNANLSVMEKAFPEFAAAFATLGRGVVKADIIRCVYLYHFGGWYLDTDYRLLRSLSSSAEAAAAGDNADVAPNSGIQLAECRLILPISGVPGRDQHLVCNSVMASEKGHPFWRLFIQHLFSQSGLRALTEGSVESTTGPLGLSRFYLAHKVEFPEIYLPEKRLFHPKITMGGFWHDGGRECYGVHWCWGSWRTKNLARRIKNIVTRKVTSVY